jgi:hypothetical protein
VIRSPDIAVDHGPFPHARLSQGVFYAFAGATRWTFLGLIAGAGSECISVDLISVLQDPSFLVPAYQVDDVIYAGVILSCLFQCPFGPNRIISMVSGLD